MGTALLIKTRLEAYFKDRIIIVGTVPGYTLTEEQIDSVDMILTTIPLPQFQSDRIIPIHHLLDNQELQQLEQRSISCLTAFRAKSPAFSRPTVSTPTVTLTTASRF